MLISGVAAPGAPLAKRPQLFQMEGIQAGFAVEKGFVEARTPFPKAGTDAVDFQSIYRGRLAVKGEEIRILHKILVGSAATFGKKGNGLGEGFLRPTIVPEEGVSRKRCVGPAPRLTVPANVFRKPFWRMDSQVGCDEPMEEREQRIDSLFKAVALCLIWVGFLFPVEGKGPLPGRTARGARLPWRSALSAAMAFANAFFLPMITLRIAYPGKGAARGSHGLGVVDNRKRIVPARRKSRLRGQCGGQEPRTMNPFPGQGL